MYGVDRVLAGKLGGKVEVYSYKSSYSEIAAQVLPVEVPVTTDCQ